MIAILSDPPLDCPACGERFSFIDAGHGFYLAQSFHCPKCLSVYQYADHATIVRAAESVVGGDLHKFVAKGPT